MPGKYSNVNFYDYTHVSVVFGVVIYLKGAQIKKGSGRWFCRNPQFITLDFNRERNKA